jgi:hypothetical protein
VKLRHIRASVLATAREDIRVQSYGQQRLPGGSPRKFSTSSEMVSRLQLSGVPDVHMLHDDLDQMRSNRS